jgi:7-carboxy-7-deazaguanine synthase
LILHYDIVMEENYLLVSDDGPGFYTIEGEGRLIGTPSVFMRLFGCNLTCKGWASPDSPWGCDSFISWSKKNKYTFEEMFKFYEENDLVAPLRQGAIWKITGGEPMLRQKPLLAFVKEFIRQFNFIPKIDFETNGTIMPDLEWADYQVTYTSSPKLSTNGDPEDKTYKPEVLRFLIEQNACFKFVITSERDLEELFRKYIDAPEVQIPKDLVWLMICAGSRKEHIENGAFVAELCKKHGFKLSPRLQLVLWDKALKV